MKHAVTVGSFGIITNKNNRVLLCHRRDYDLWNLLGGGLEKGESPWQCAVREIKEETGLDVEVKRLVGVYAKEKKTRLYFLLNVLLSVERSEKVMKQMI